MFQKIGLRASLTSVCLVVGVVAGGGAQAVTYNFTDGSNATGTFDNTTGILMLTNTLANPTDVVGAISGFVFSFTTSTGSASLSSQASSSGNLVSIVKDGPGTLYAGTPVNWVLSGAGTSVLTLDANHSCAVGGGAPCDLIIGPPGSAYSNANGSIGSHSPFIYETGVFSIAGVLGLTLNTVQFRYGTTPTLGSVLTPTCGPNGGSCAQGPGGEVPLPAALPLLASALVGMGLIARRRKVRLATSSTV